MFVEELQPFQNAFCQSKNIPLPRMFSSYYFETETDVVLSIDLSPVWQNPSPTCRFSQWRNQRHWSIAGRRRSPWRPVWTQTECFRGAVMAGWFCGYLMINNKALAWTGHRHHVVHYIVFACFLYLYSTSVSVPGHWSWSLFSLDWSVSQPGIASLRQTDTNLLLLSGALPTPLPAARRVCVHTVTESVAVVTVGVGIRLLTGQISTEFILWNSHFSLYVLSTALLNFIVLGWLFILATSTDIYDAII